VTVKFERHAAVLTAASRGTLGHSANMAIRRAAFQAVGGFDERLGPGTRFRAAEDNDLFDRLFAAGFEGRYEPDVLGWHEQWRSRRELVKLEWSYGVGTGARLAKLARSDRSRAKVVWADDLWANGLRILPRLVRERYEFGVAFVLARVGGALLGFVGAVARGLPRRATVTRS
jgi:GT2 family glycosyltransferase